MEPDQASEQPRFLTDFILELGYTTKESISTAIEAARLTNKTAEQLLVEQGHITQDQLGHALAARYDTEYIDLAAYPVDMEAAREVTRTVARRCGVVPIAFDGPDALVVAIFDSAGVAAAGDVAALTRHEVHPVVASQQAVEGLIEQLPEREVIRPGRSRPTHHSAQPPVEPAHSQAPAAGPPPAAPQQQPPVPNMPLRKPAEPLSDDLLERVSQIADTSREVDLSPDLRVVGGAETDGSPEQGREHLRAELDRLVELEREFRMTLGQVSERMRAAGALPGSNERISELEEQLAVAERARAEAESERDELRRRLMAIRDTLGRGEQL